MSPPAKLTAEQAGTLAWVATIGAVTAPALALRDGCSRASARGRLEALARRGLTQRARPLTAQPTLYLATRDGLRALPGIAASPARVSAASAAHAAACAEAAATLHRLYGAAVRVAGEPLLRGASGLSWASARLPGAAGARHRPDLLLWRPGDPGSLPIAIEVELSVKAPRRLAEIALAWARCRQVGGVVYFVAADVEQPVRRAIEAARAEASVAVVTLAAAAPDGTIPSGA